MLIPTKSFPKRSLFIRISPEENKISRYSLEEREVLLGAEGG